MIKGMLIAGGVLNALFAIFHVFFWKMFKWPSSLMCLDLNNRAIIQTFNLVTIVILLFFAIVSFFFIEQLSTSSLGSVVMLTIAVFWLTRAVCEFVYWGEAWNMSSWIILVLCMAIIALYVIPVIPVFRNI